MRDEPGQRQPAVGEAGEQPVLGLVDVPGPGQAGVIAICPIATAWDAQELQVASKVSENKQGDWLPTIPAFFTAGEKDRFKQHSLALAAKVGKSESRHQVETFDFGHEVPRSVDAISKLVRFVKKHSESKLSARKMVR